jgi:hypothetical protein
MAELAYDRFSERQTLDCVMGRLEPTVRASFTDEQRAALNDALAARAWRDHSVDIRFHLPFAASRYYLRLVADREKRSIARQRTERTEHPLATIGNTLFVGAISMAVCTLVIFAVLVYSAILVP